MIIDEVREPGPDWDEFAEAHPSARLGHAAAWSRILNEAYGLESRNLCARDEGGSIRGILPLAVFRSRPLGPRKLISLPYLDGAGILAADAEIEKELLDHAVGLLDGSAFSALELRCALSETPTSLDDSTQADRVNLAMPLASDPEDQWKAFRAKVRNQTRKAEKEGLRIAEGDAATLERQFYGPFRVNMRDLGSPVHAPAFFRFAARHFGNRLRFIVTADGDRPVGGLVAIRFGARVTVPWASTLRSERKRCPNNQIYWEAIRWAIECGASCFDFGRSPRDGGTYRFKKGWGASEEALSWRRFDARGVAVPSLASPPSPLLEHLSQIWTRLPVSTASFLGARIRRYFSN